MVSTDYKTQNNRRF